MKIGVLVNIGYTLDAFFKPLVSGWEREGHVVVTAAGDKAQAFQNTVLSGVTRRPSPRNIFASRQLEKWASDNSLDVIVASNATTSALARFPRLKVPVVYFCHGLHWNTGTRIGDRLWMAIERSLLRNTRAVLCMNTDDCRWFNQHFRPMDVHYLRYGVGVPFSAFPFTQIQATPSLNLLWAGEFSSRKRPWLMVDAAARLRSEGVDFRLTMLGDGPLRNEIAERVRQLALDDVVTLAGYQPLYPYLEQCSLLVHTSLWEGLPRVMLEARATGRRSVAFDVKGVRDIPDVALVPDGDMNAFVKQVACCWDDIATHGQRLPPPPDEMGTDSVAHDIVAFLEDVVANPN